MGRPANGPAAGIAAVIRRSDAPFVDHILLIQRKASHGAGTWAAPGGWVEDHESVIDAVHREVKEEVGLLVTNVHRGSPEWTHSIFEDGTNSVCLWFECDAVNPENAIIGEPDKIANMVWVPSKNALALPLFDHLDQFLEEALAP